jgi:8-oxo-dGTP diphosphatase
LQLIRRLKYFSRYRYRNLWVLLHGSKWVAAGAIIFNEDGRILLIKHRWRGDWEYPVGTTDDAESPLEAAKREVAEEVGLAPTGFRLLGVDFFRRRTPNGNLVFTFAAHVDRRQERELKLEEYEISDHRWATRQQAQELISDRLKDRFRQMLEAYDHDTTIYLQNGEPAAR